MPLIVLVGTPCSGKSYCSEHLKHHFEKKNKNVVLISDENYFQTNQRNSVFKGRFTWVLDFNDQNPDQIQLLKMYD